MAQLNDNTVQQSQQSAQYHSDPVQQYSFDRGITGAFNTASNMVYHYGKGGSSTKDTRMDNYENQVVKPVFDYAEANNLTEIEKNQLLYDKSHEWAQINNMNIRDVLAGYRDVTEAKTPENIRWAASLESQKKFQEANFQYTYDLAQNYINDGMSEEDAQATAKRTMAAVRKSKGYLNMLNVLQASGDTEQYKATLDEFINYTTREGLQNLGEVLKNKTPEQIREFFANSEATFPALISSVAGENTEAAAGIQMFVRKSMNFLRDESLKYEKEKLQLQDEIYEHGLEAARKGTLIRLINSGHPELLLLNLKEAGPADFEKAIQAVTALKTNYGIDFANYALPVNVSSFPLSNAEYNSFVRVADNTNNGRGKNIANSVITYSKDAQAPENSSKVRQQYYKYSPAVIETMTPSDKAETGLQAAYAHATDFKNVFNENKEFFADKFVLVTEDGQIHVYDSDGNSVESHPMQDWYRKVGADVKRIQKAGIFDTDFFAKDIAKQVQGLIPPTEKSLALQRIGRFKFDQVVSNEDLLNIEKTLKVSETLENVERRVLLNRKQNGQYTSSQAAREANRRINEIENKRIKKEFDKYVSDTVKDIKRMVPKALESNEQFWNAVWSKLGLVEPQYYSSNTSNTPNTSNTSEESTDTWELVKQAIEDTGNVGLNNIYNKHLQNEPVSVEEMQEVEKAIAGYRRLKNE